MRDDVLTFRKLYDVLPPTCANPGRATQATETTAAKICFTAIIR